MKYSIDIFLEIGNTEIIKTFVEKGIGISLLPKLTINNEIKEGKLSILDINNCKINMWTQLIYHQNKFVSAEMDTFILLASKYLIH